MNRQQTHLQKNKATQEHIDTKININMQRYSQISMATQAHRQREIQADIDMYLRDPNAHCKTDTNRMQGMLCTNSETRLETWGRPKR